MVEAEAFTPQPTSNAIQSVLRLLHRHAMESAVLLGSQDGRGKFWIEDLVPRSSRVGQSLPLPVGLLADDARLIGTSKIRLPLGWTEACGTRPVHIASAPIPGHDLHIIMAATEQDVPDVEALVDAAGVISELLQQGESTKRTQDRSHRMSALINHLPEPLVFVDSRNMRVLLNEEARLLLELPPGDLQEHNVAIALARLMSGAGAGSHRPQLSADPTARLAFEIETKPRTFKVESCWIDQPELTGRIWQFSDITLERAYWAKQTDLSVLLQLTIDNVGDGVALIEESLSLSLWNSTFTDLVAHPSVAITKGDNLVELIRGSDEIGVFASASHGEAAASLAAYLRTDATSTLELSRSDGRILNVRRNSLSGGRFILIVRDVSAERQAARLKDELVSTVSHELRTPITSILGSLQLLKNAMLDFVIPQAQNLVGIAERNAERLSRLVDDLLDLDKLETGELELNLETLDLRELLSDASDQNRPYAGTFGVAVVVDIPAAQVPFSFDRFRMAQVVSNLVSNAAKFSTSGSSIVLRLAKLPGIARISVIDQGAGVPAEFRGRLFTRFAHQSSPLPDRPAGTGLGLAIAKKIVEQHGGRLHLDTTTEIGATFHIDLPL